MDGLFDAAKELFGYNRESFMFDSELRMKREYQEQNLRVRQFMLYREDVRDLTELTTGKMDSYLLVALLELGCCFDLLVHGELELNGHGSAEQVNQPDWLLWLYVVSLSEAFVYLFLSAWFAIHASVAAHSFAVRLLTQFVRLPVPDKSKLDAARAYAAEFEGSGAGQMMRVPMLGQLAAASTRSQESENSQEQASGQGIGAALATMNMDSANHVAMLKHVRVYRNLQSNWQAHDAYARACLALGTYTLVQAVAYYTIGYFVVELHSVWPALGTSIILPGLAWLLIRLDLYFSNYAMVCWALFLMLGPFLAWVATVMEVLPPLWAERFRGVDYILVPVNFFMHVALIASIVLAASADRSDDVSLPTRFRTVLYLDVFGWITDPEARQLQERAAQESREGNRRTGQQLPPQLVESLKRECRLLITALHLEFQAWDSQAVAPSVTATPGLPGALQEGREAFAQLKRLLALDTPGPQETVEPMPRLWLRLVPEGAVECYICPETGEVRREPPEGASVSDLTSLRQHLVALSQRCELLHASGQTVQTSAFQSVDSAGGLGLQMGSTSSASTLLRSPDMLQPVDTTSLFAVPEAARASTGSDVRVGASSLASPLGGSTVGLRHTETWPLPGQANLMSTASAGSVGPLAASMPVGGAEGRTARQARLRSAQETRFGGSEAAQLDALPNRYSHSPGSAQTFHPRQDGRRESRRPPGQVPWITFLAASVLVGSVWILGVGQYVVEPLIKTFSHHKHRSLAAPFSARLVHAASAWPRRPVDLSPTGLACDSSHGSAAFLSERYTVYEVPLDGRPPRQSQVAHACLARAPAFHAAGIGGVSLENVVGDWALLMRSTDGSRALRCPLEEGSRRQPSIVVGRMARDLQLEIESGWDRACRWGERLITMTGAEVWEVVGQELPNLVEQTA